jgi:hypothetical protein
MALQQRIVTQDIREIPAHCVPLSSFGGRRNKRGGSWEYETLHTLCKRREIKHWKFERGRTGQLFVEPDVAREMLDSLRQHKINAISPPKACKPQADLQYESVCESMADIATSLASVERLLERLAVAAESMATQPRTAQQELLHTINGNPAPWNET